MKKIIIAIFFMFVITGCTSNNYSKIKYNDLMNIINNKDTFIILFDDGSDDAKLLKNTLNKVLNNNNLEAYIIDSTKITQEEKNKLRPIISYEDISIVFIKEGIDSSKLSHITDSQISTNNLENHLENLEFITK